MSYDLSVALRFSLTQFTSEPTPSVGAEELAGAIGLFELSQPVLGVSDTVVLSDSPSSSVDFSLSNADTIVLSDAPASSLFQPVAYRHTIVHLSLDNYVIIPVIME